MRKLELSLGGGGGGVPPGHRAGQGPTRSGAQGPGLSPCVLSLVHAGWGGGKGREHGFEGLPQPAHPAIINNAKLKSRQRQLPAP